MFLRRRWIIKTELIPGEPQITKRFWTLSRAWDVVARFTEEELEFNWVEGPFPPEVLRIQEALRSLSATNHQRIRQEFPELYGVLLWARTLGALNSLPRAWSHLADYDKAKFGSWMPELRRLITEYCRRHGSAEASE